jgi:hypothetical protein
MSIDSDDLTTLDDLEQIRLLKARYFRFADTKQWDEFRALFTNDCQVDTGVVPGDDDPNAVGFRATNADQFVATVRERLSGGISVHHGHTPEIELTGPSTAKGIWALFDLVRRGPGSPFPSWRGYGHYHEEYRKEEGVWRISSLRLTRLLLEPAEALDSTSS